MARPRSDMKHDRELAELARFARDPEPLDLDVLARLPGVTLRARYLVESFLTGRHRSPLKGTAPEFAEYRAYQPGDDLRRIDWRLYARSDRLVVKQFEDETQLQVCLALDVSASLRYASTPALMTKFDFARTLLAAVAWLSRRQHDAVALAFLGEGPSADAGVLDYLRAGAAPAHYRAVLSRLDAPIVARTCALAEGLRRVGALGLRGGIVVLASDFYVDPAALAAVLGELRAQRQEVLALQVLDPMEVDFHQQLDGAFLDLETGVDVALHARAVRDGYLARFREHQRELLAACRRHGADLVTVRTDGNPLDALSAYLAQRARRAA